MHTANQFICDLNPYRAGMPIEQVARERGWDPKSVSKLASNENPLGASPKALQALKTKIKEVYRYPEHHELLTALSDKFDLDPRCVVIGNGSNDIIDLVARIYLDQGDESVISQYAFAMYRIAAQSVGATTITAPAREFGHDLHAMLAAISPRTKVVWIANPNNPTGTYIQAEKIKQFLDNVPREVVVVLDEAYFGYSVASKENSLHWPQSCPNLVVLRTFSKIYGLAGLRVGYAVASREVAEFLNRVRLPFNVSGPAIAAASAALHDDEFVRQSHGLNTQELNKLLNALQRMGLACMPAHGNFITFRAGNAGQIYEALLDRGIVLRPLVSYELPEWLRISVGLPAENQRFLTALAEIINK